MPGPAALDQRLDQRKHRAGVGAEVGFEIELAAGQQDGDAVIADRAGQQDLVARRAPSAAPSVTPGMRRPMPVVVMYMPVGLAVLDDLGVAAGDRDARRRARPRPSRALRPRASSVGSPASSTKVTTRATGRAPDTARSFTVPFTASSPIEPPGKRSGVTTKLSVVIATGASRPMSTWAASPRRSPAAPSVEEQRREQAFDQPAAGLAAGAVRHLDLRVAEPDRRAGRRPPDGVAVRPASGS